MNQTTIIQNTVDFVKKTMDGQGAGHDYWHAWRVWNLAKKIARSEGGDLFVIQLAALLHDVDDYKFAGNGKTVKAKAFLEKQGLNEKTITTICQVISGVSFKGAKVKHEIKTIEGKIVQDADRLDALGAIGIGRAFAYGGSKGRLEHHPEAKTVLHSTFEEYKARQSTTINHFHEKILLLKERMNTKTAKKIAAKRHAFTKKFIDEYMKEWSEAR